MTFDLEIYFCAFSFQAIYFEWLDLATSFPEGRDIFSICRLRFSFKVMGPRSRIQQRILDFFQFRI